MVNLSENKPIYIANVIMLAFVILFPNNVFLWQLKQPSNQSTVIQRANIIVIVSLYLTMFFLVFVLYKAVVFGTTII